MRSLAKENPGQFVSLITKGMAYCMGIAAALVIFILDHDSSLAKYWWGLTLVLALIGLATSATCYVALLFLKPRVIDTVNEMGPNYLFFALTVSFGGSFGSFTFLVTAYSDAFGGLFLGFILASLLYVARYICVK